MKNSEFAVSKLKELYPGDLKCLIYKEPYQLLIAVRLSAQCTDARVNIVTKDLFLKYKTIDDFANADFDELAKDVRTCGFYKMKAQSIISTCQSLRDRFDGKVPDNMDDLLSLSGVGRKSANLILGDIYGKPAIVADTHCIRISNRLGFADSVDPYKVELALKEIIAEGEQNNFCHRLVLFGREICKSRGPKCGICPLVKICKYYKKRLIIDN